MKEFGRAAAREYERHILATDRPYHVEGRYGTNEYNAEPKGDFASGRMVMERQRRAALDVTATVAARVRVGTWLASRERDRVDVAASAQFDLTHRDTIHAIRSDLMTGRIHAALVSAALMRPADVPAVSAIVRDFPASPVVGFVDKVDERQALASALVLGHAGVAVLVDARTATGWSTLRSAFDARRLADPFVQRAVRELTSARDGQVSEAACTAGWVRFLAATFSPRVATAKQVAELLGVCYSTLTSRFYRAGLPSPRCYIAHARLVWAARLGETPGLPISAIADRLDASSPQSFGRTVRTMLGVTPANFRRTYDGHAMLAHFRAELVEPYRETLRTFDPLTVSQADREEIARRCSTRRGLTTRSALRAVSGVRCLRSGLRPSTAVRDTRVQAHATNLPSRVAD